MNMGIYIWVEGQSGVPRKQEWGATVPLLGRRGDGGADDQI